MLSTDNFCFLLDWGRRKGEVYLSFILLKRLELPSNSHSGDGSYLLIGILDIEEI
jgi:hypothetical protein